MVETNIVKFPVKKQPVSMDDILQVLIADKDKLKTVFVIGFTKDNEVMLTHTPFTDEEMVFFAKVLDVYSNQVIESLIEDSSISFLPEGG